MQTGRGGQPVADGCSAGDVLDTLPDGVVVVGADRRVEFVNPRAEKLIGLPSRHAVGMQVADVLPLLDEAGRSWWHCSDPWGGLDIRTGHREKMLLLAGRGQVLVTMRYLREVPRGPVVRVVVALRDTDARRRAEAESAELISLVAHELRAPLASVKGFSTTLLTRWDRFDDDQKHLMIQTIESDADRLARLIHELLDVSRLDTSRLRLDRRRLDLAALVERCVERLVASGLDPGRFEVTVEDTVPGPERVPAHGDVDRLDQVLMNVLENAVRHGAGTVSVRVGAPVPDGDGAMPDGGAEAWDDRAMWEVCVADEGEGVRPEHRTLVFSKFWHGQRRGSTGLGLYLAHGLVEAHGGTIRVDQAPEGGARFRFTVPRASAH